MRNLIFDEEKNESWETCKSDDITKSNIQCDNDSRQSNDLRKLLKEAIEENKVFCSFELFPVQNPGNTYQRFFLKSRKYCPLFYALTWHNKKEWRDNVSLKLVREFPPNTLLHLAAKGLRKLDVEVILEEALASGINNLFVLRGDDISEASGDFPHAIDLVSFIRNRYGNRFCICVAGYPEMHPESPSKELDMFYLKAKIDAGADLVITQIVFEARIFLDFVKACREIGIEVPIIPGIFPFPNFKCLKKMATICKVQVPEKILDNLLLIQDDDEAVCNYGNELSKCIIQDILKAGITIGVHIFTLNRISAVEVCEKLTIFNGNTKV